MASKEPKNKVNFTVIKPEQKVLLLKTFSDANGELVIWKKGDKMKNLFFITEYNEEKDHIQLQSLRELADIRNQADILANFTFKGLEYFSKAKVFYTGKEKATLQLLGDLYRCERRENFRLRNTEDKNFKITFNITSKVSTNKDKTNILDFSILKKKTDQAFGDFIKLVSPENSSTKQTYYLHDLSVNGLSFIISTLEKDLFEVDKEINNIVLKLNDKNYLISKGIIKHIEDFKDEKRKKAKFFKIGIMFSHKDTRVKEELFKTIFKLIRDRSSYEPFEDFIT